jgi:hypothetical protein
MPVNCSYLMMLKRLKKKNIQFAVTGTYALFLHKNSFSDYYTIQNCDIFLVDDPQNITQYIELMQENDYEVMDWEEPVRMMEEEATAGKHWLRSVRENLVLDAAYDFIPEFFGDFTQDIIYLDGIPVIAANKIIERKMHLGRAKDFEAIKAYKHMLYIG